jgi:DNA-binding transcriptional LysR family regulator
MEIKQLEALRVIAETGSFSAAATQLRLTQSALSHQIRHLEEELGETLLIRARPKVYASPAGQIVLASAERIMAEINTVKQHFPISGKGPVQGTLRVAATSLGIAHIYGDLCEAFVAEYPGIEVIFRTAETPEESVRRVVAGSADVAFTPLPVAFPQIETVQFGTTEHVFIVGRTHPLAGARATAAAELRQWPFVRFQPGTGSRIFSDQVFLADGGYPSIVTESNDAEFVKRIVSIGQSSALIPVFAIHREIAAGTLKPLRLKGRKLSDGFGLVHRRDVRMKSIELLKALCLRICGPEPRHLTVENAGRLKLRPAASPKSKARQQ